MPKAQLLNLVLEVTVVAAILLGHPLVAVTVREVVVVEDPPLLGKLRVV
jgi:hypothetical protein